MKLEKFKLLLLIVGYNQVSNSKFITNLTSNKGNEQYGLRNQKSI